MLKNRYIFIPLGSEELYDLLSQLLRVAGYVHGKACVCVEGGGRERERHLGLRQQWENAICPTITHINLLSQQQLFTKCFDRWAKAGY